MALKAILTAEEHGQLADALKGEYKAGKDGAFVLDVIKVGGWELDDVSNLKKALGQERTNAKQAKDQLEAFKDLDPDAAREALEKVGQMKDWTPKDKLDESIKQREEALKQQFAKEKSTLETDRKMLATQLEDMLITSSATSAIQSAKGSIKLLLPHVRSFTRLRRLEDGRHIAEVVDDKGNVRVGDSNGNPMTIPQLVEELKSTEDFAAAFQGNGSTGSGANNNSTGRQPTTTQTGQPRQIKRSDQAAINAGMEDIAAGKAVVVDE